MWFSVASTGVLSAKHGRWWCLSLMLIRPRLEQWPMEIWFTKPYHPANRSLHKSRNLSGMNCCHQISNPMGEPSGLDNMVLPWHVGSLCDWIQGEWHQTNTVKSYPWTDPEPLSFKCHPPTPRAHVKMPLDWIPQVLNQSVWTKLLLCYKYRPVSCHLYQ